MQQARADLEDRAKARAETQEQIKQLSSKRAAWVAEALRSQ